MSLRTQFQNAAFTFAFAAVAGLTPADAGALTLVKQAEANKLVDDAASVTALPTARHALDARILKRLADRYAASMNGGEAHLTSVGRRILGDLDGKAAAHVSTYARGRAETSTERSNGLDSRSVALASALADGAAELTATQASAFRAPGRYVTAILGATRAHKRLISLGAGLPPQAFEAVARQLVATQTRRRAQDFSARAFVEPDMPRGRDLGVLVTAGAVKYVFLLPSAGAPNGRVVTEAIYRAHRNTVLDARRLGEATQVGIAAPRTATAKQDLAARIQGPAWDALIAKSRGESPADAAMRYSPLEAAPQVGGGLQMPGGFFPYADDDCTCTKSFLDGSSQSVISCNGFGDTCCEWVDGEFQDDGHCPNTCTCECEENVHVEGVTDYGVFIRGVPTLFQQQVTVPWSLVCEDEVAVGCGAIVATALLSWYDGMGHEDLSDGFRDGSGRIEWQDMAETLRNDFLGSHCWGDATWTLPGDLQAGIRNFITDQGEAFDSVDLTSHLDADEANAFARIRGEIDASRPIILGFDSSNNNGLGGAIDHYGIISGYVDDNIYVNMGWGYGGNETFEFEIGAGWWIYLLSVNMDNIAGFGGAGAMCAADGLSTMFTDTSDTSWTCEEDTYDSYPVMDDIGGVDCDQIGGEEAFAYDYVDHRTSTMRCLTPAEKERLDASIKETMEELNGFNEPLDELDPLP